MTVRLSIVLAAVVAAAACSGPTAMPSASPSPSRTAIPPAAPAVAKTSTWDGVYTADQAERGATLFASTCNKCHGPAAAGKTDDGGRLVGKGFFEMFDNSKLDQLFTSIYTLMPLDNPKSLSTKQVADIASYLLQQNGMPAGSMPMSESAEQLKGLKISASKP